MNIEKVVMFIWGCVTLVFVSMFIASAFLETIKVWRLSNGTTISLEIGGLAEVCLIISAYYLIKLLITKNNK